MTDRRELVTTGRAKAMQRVTDLTDRMDETALGKKLAKAQGELDFWNEQYAALPPAEPKPLPSSGRASEKAVEPTLEDPELTKALRGAGEQFLNAMGEEIKDDGLDPPAFLKRGAHG